MLSANDLEFMRESNESLMPDTCTILSKTSSADGAGGVTDTWGTASTSICRVDFESGVMQLAGGAVQPFSRLILWLPYNAVITCANRVSWDGVVYSVSSIQNDSWQTLTKAEIHAV